MNGAGGGTTKYDDEGNLIAVAGTVGAALSGEEGICAASIERKGWADFNSGVRAASEVFERRDTVAADPMLMYFSSGTSGNPKMVLHNSGYAVAHLITAKHWHNVQPTVFTSPSPTRVGARPCGASTTGSGSWKHASSRTISIASMRARFSRLSRSTRSRLCAARRQCIVS